MKKVYAPPPYECPDWFSDPPFVTCPPEGGGAGEGQVICMDYDYGVRAACKSATYGYFTIIEVRDDGDGSVIFSYNYGEDLPECPENPPYTPSAAPSNVSSAPQRAHMVALGLISSLLLVLNGIVVLRADSL
eukprot:scaffold3904_cov47-Attheya_sp.AAC.6